MQLYFPCFLLEFDKLRQREIASEENAQPYPCRRQKHPVLAPLPTRSGNGPVRCFSQISSKRGVKYFIRNMNPDWTHDLKAGIARITAVIHCIAHQVQKIRTPIRLNRIATLSLLHCHSSLRRERDSFRIFMLEFQLSMRYNYS